MPESYSVRIAKAEHVFSAAHFITYAGQCERLHGHNYRVAAEIFGTLNEDSLVVDFLAVRAALREIVGRLDHFVLLPAEHRELTVKVVGDEVHVAFASRRWIFPRGDCRLLPVANTTAELLAAHIGRELQLALEHRCGRKVPQLRVELDECDGQLARWQSRPGPGWPG
jgi:6-pyruvoyltetrahydropterin/6-carboxytetrahydropterin synthase